MVDKIQAVHELIDKLQSWLKHEQQPNVYRAPSETAEEMCARFLNK